MPPTSASLLRQRTRALHYFQLLSPTPSVGNCSTAESVSQNHEQVRLRYGFVVVGYLVMPEHIHLLIIEPDRGTPSTVMQVLNQRFARRVLSELRRKERPDQSRLWQETLEAGHVWQRRFYDFVVRSEEKKIRS